MKPLSGESERESTRERDIKTDVLTDPIQNIKYRLQLKTRGKWGMNSSDTTKTYTRPYISDLHSIVVMIALPERRSFKHSHVLLPKRIFVCVRAQFCLIKMSACKPVWPLV